MKKKSSYRITYNAPITLTFALLSALILFIDSNFMNRHLINVLFVAPGCQSSTVAFNWHSPLDYFKLFSHILGHSDWNHLLSNFSFILLLGPILEERYGSAVLLVMILVTALVTGVINACLIPAGLMGSSGIAFMMILLASFSTMSRHEIPLSFFLILFLYIGRDLFANSKAYNIATFAHIAGGICGSMFGFLAVSKRRPTGEKGIKSAEKAETSKKIFNKQKNKKTEGAVLSDNLSSASKDTPIAQEFASLTTEENPPNF